MQPFGVVAKPDGGSCQGSDDGFQLVAKRKASPSKEVRTVSKPVNTHNHFTALAPATVESGVEVTETSGVERSNDVIASRGEPPDSNG